MKIWNRKRAVLGSDKLSDFCRHVGAMCSAGIPLAKAMEILQISTEQKKWKLLYKELQERMEQGYSFSHAMEETGAFPELLLNMFRAAEHAGRLEETAKRMEQYYRKEHHTKNKIRTATVYPKILGLVSVFVVLMVFLVVMPTVMPLFEGVKLPLLTRLLMNCSEYLEDNWYLVLFLLWILFLMARFAMKKKRIQIFLDRMKVHIPFLGRQVCIIYTARFARCESSLYSSGIPMVESLEIAAKTIGNTYIEAQFQNVIEKVKGGSSFSKAIQDVDGFHPGLAPVIFVGEETGTLDTMLTNLADGYEHDAEMAMNQMVAMIEPALILGMGLVIGVILLGIMMPMWSMYEYMV